MTEPFRAITNIEKLDELFDLALDCKSPDELASETIAGPGSRKRVRQERQEKLRKGRLYQASSSKF